MADTLTFKCPCCTAALSFSGATGEMTCEYCGASFTMEQAKAAQELEKTSAAASDMTWTAAAPSLIQDEAGKVSGYRCTSCGAEMMADETTAATECPYCGNNAIIHQSFEGVYRPDLVVPFSVDRAAAQEALRKFYAGKKLLPRAFTDQRRIENITGLYVPFWLMSCRAEGSGAYEGIKEKRWEDSRFRYVKKDFYHLVRQGKMAFSRIPADASTKMDDDTMDSLEPYDVEKAVPYDAAYFSGYLADRYDVAAADVQERAGERVRNTFREKLDEDARRDYDHTTRKEESVRLRDTKTEYAMLPVWMLSTRYEGKIYSFAMNGQTGKVAGSLPVDKGQYRKYLALASGIALVVILALIFLLGGHQLRPGGVIGGAVVSLLIGWIYASALKSGMNTVAAGTSARSYLEGDSVRVTRLADQFLYSKTERTEKQAPSSGAAAQSGATGAPGARPAQGAQRPRPAQPDRRSGGSARPGGGQPPRR